MNSGTVLAFDTIKSQLESFCPSLIAKEMARELAPSTDREQVIESLMEVGEALLSLQTEREQPLGGTRDIRLAASKSKKEMILTHEELWNIFITIGAYRRMHSFFMEKYAYYPLLSLWIQDMPLTDALEQKLKRIFDDKGQLRDDASPRLRQLRQTMQQLKDKVKRELQAILSDKDNQKYFQDAIVTQRNDRYVIPVKQEYRYAFDGLIHDKSATGATLYIEPMAMVRINNDLQEATLEEEKEIQKIYKDMSLLVKKDADDLLDACQRVSHVEFVYGKAEYGLSYKGIVADTSADQSVVLLKGRHPLLPPKKVVPSTIHLGKDYQILLITGSNTGGKTVTLKTLGLLALMHQAGLCVPAEQGTSLPIFDGIYADIGDDQSISENLSTFSAHMTQIKRIMDEVTPNSLVLLDELGSGTDPEEGSALAVAILDHFRKLGPLMMVTTHYNELKNYAYETPGLENGHVEFDEKTLRPTYRLHIGVAGSSHAFSIADRLGIPKVVIESAKEARKNAKNSDMELILSELNEQLRQSQLKEERLQVALSEARELKKQAERERKRVEEKKKEILEKAKADALNMKRSVKVESAQIIKDLKAQFTEQNVQKRQEVIQEARKAVEAIPVPQGYVQKRQKLKESEVKAGDRVFVNSLETVATILSVDRKRIQVDVNGLSMAVKIGDISQVTREESQAAKQKEKEKSKASEPRKRVVRATAVARQQEATTEINILGQTVDEGIMSVERFIDQAMLAGISSVRIIHGKGTGALRSGILDYLKHSPVVSYYEVQADAGSTIAMIK